MVSFNTASQFNNLGLLNSQFAALQRLNPQSLTQLQGLNGFPQGLTQLQGLNGFPQSFFQGQQGIFAGVNGQQPPSPEEMFSSLDSNSDGSLTQTEFDNGPKPPGLPEPTDAMKTAMWQRLDADSSGTVSLTEFEQAGPPPGGPGGFGQFGGINGQFGLPGRQALDPAERTQRRTEEFTNIDTNADGSLSATELDNMPAPTDGRPAPTAQMKADMLDRMDTDGDGSISEDEFVNAPPPPFPPGGGQFNNGINGQFGTLQGLNLQQLPAGFQNLLSQFGGNINFSNLFSNTV
jgi:Ca2+-binding EF-hand superfamily protein